MSGNDLSFNPLSLEESEELLKQAELLMQEEPAVPSAEETADPVTELLGPSVEQDPFGIYRSSYGETDVLATDDGPGFGYGALAGLTSGMGGDLLTNLGTNAAAAVDDVENFLGLSTPEDDVDYVNMFDPVVNRSELSDDGRAGYSGGQSLGTGLTIALGGWASGLRAVSNFKNATGLSAGGAAAGNPADVLADITRTRLAAANAGYNLPARYIAAASPSGSMAARMADDGIDAARLGGMVPGLFVEGTETILRNPSSALTAEGASLLGSSWMAFNAENWFPGNTAASIGLETAGGFSNVLVTPARVLAQQASNMTRGWGAAGEVAGARVADSMAGVDPATSTLGRASTSVKNKAKKEAFRLQALWKGEYAGSYKQQNAAEAFSLIMRQLGEDPVEFAKTLDSQLEVMERVSFREDVPAGYIVYNEAFMAIQNKLVDDTEAFYGASVARAADDHYNRMNELIDSFTQVGESSGDPQALAIAARLRQQQFSDMLSTVVERYQNEAITAYNRLIPDGVTDSAELVKYRAEAATRAREVFEEAAERLNGYENSLWEAADLSTPLRDIPEAQAALDAMETDLLNYMEDAPSNIATPLLKDLEAMMNGDATLNNVKRVRTQLMSLNVRDNAELKQYVGATVKSLTDVLRNSGDPNVLHALDFSKSKYEVLNSGPMGDILNSDPTATRFVEPGNTLNSVTSTRDSTNAANLERMRNVTDAADNLPVTEAGLMNDDVFLSAMAGVDNTSFDAMLTDEISGTLAAVAANFVDDRGAVNYRRLSNYIRNNPNVLEKFPETRAKMLDAESAAREYDRILKSNKYDPEHYMKEKSFMRVFGDGINDIPPSTTIRHILDSSNPDSAYRSMAVTAKRAEDAGVAFGARSVMFGATLEYARNRSGGSWSSMRDILFEANSRPNSSRSLIRTMELNGIVTEDQVDSLRVILDIGVNQELAQAFTHQLTRSANEGLSIGADTVVRVGGASAASNLAAQLGLNTGSASGSSLIIASQGSRLARQLFEEAPEAKQAKVMMDLIRQPKLLAELMLVQRAGEQMGRPVASLYTSYLWAMGVHNGIVEPMTPEEYVTRGEVPEMPLFDVDSEEEDEMIRELELIGEL